MSNLPTPDFTFDPTLAGACVAGVRPYRNGSYRLEAVVDLAGKFVVHNYGHGGAGITLSWGCAAKVRDLVKRHLVGTYDAKVAVLGAGVMGLTSATRLRELGGDDLFRSQAAGYHVGEGWRPMGRVGRGI